MSTCARRVLTTAEELGLSYELVPVNFAAGEHKSAEYLEKHQPFGQIPVLWDGDFRLYESRAICRYLTLKTSSSSTLYPEDVKQRALVEQWISVETSNYPAPEIVKELVFNPMFGAPSDQTKVDAATPKLHQFFSVLEKQLSQTKYVAGDNFTLADIVLMPYTEYLLKTTQFAKVLDQYPHVSQWWSAVSARPSWQKVLAMK